MFWARYVLDAGEILDVGVVVVVAKLRKAPSPNPTGSPRSIISPGEPELELSIAICVLRKNLRISLAILLSR
jgi:hypothetical protein